MKQYDERAKKIHKVMWLVVSLVYSISIERNRYATESCIHVFVEWPYDFHACQQPAAFSSSLHLLFTECAEGTLVLTSIHTLHRHKHTPDMHKACSCACVCMYTDTRATAL